MKNKILFIQFANSMYETRDEESCAFWDAFYRKYRKDGYWRYKHPDNLFWDLAFEIPKWIAEVSFLLRGTEYEQELFWCLEDVREAVRKINETPNIKYAMMSLMDANKHFIREIVRACPNVAFVIGGYNNEAIQNLARDFSNVIPVDSMKDEARLFDVPYVEGTDYVLFKNSETIPRLTLSTGCLCSCKFCIVPHGKVTPKPESVIWQQVESFKDLYFKLIYIDDKTFGQCKNWSILKDIYENIKSWNSEFCGFIVQTRPAEAIARAKEFADNHVRVVEMGLETYNQEILDAYRKGITAQSVRTAIKRLKESGIEVILNLVVGFPEESAETYKNTLEFVAGQYAIGNVMSVNPAIYTDYSQEDNTGELDFPNTDAGTLGRIWWDKICRAFKNLLKYV